MKGIQKCVKTKSQIQVISLSDKMRKNKFLNLPLRIFCFLATSQGYSMSTMATMEIKHIFSLVLIQRGLARSKKCAQQIPK